MIFRYYKELLLLFFTLILCLICIEIVTRTFYEPYDAGFGLPNGLYIPDKDLGYIHNPNFKGTFNGKDYEKVPLIINSLGLRDREFNFSKEDKLYRIIILGDSITFGVGINSEDTYPKQLESKLNKNYEVLNFGVAGYNIDQIITNFKKEALKYNPNAILYGLCINDLSPEDIIALQKARLDSKQSINRFIKDNCKFCLLVHRIIKGSFFFGEEDYAKQYFNRVYELWENDTSFNIFQTKLKEMKKLAEENNIRLIFLILPAKEQFEEQNLKLPQERMKKFCLNENIECVDDFKELSYNYSLNFIKYDDMHYTKDGNKIIANKLLNLFK